MNEKRVYYRSDEITVSYAPDVCIHAAECVKGLPKVFNPTKKPWVSIDAEPAIKIADTIKKCPTGALQFEMKNIGKKINEVNMEKTKITVMPNGPLMVEGNLTVNKTSGEKIKEGEKLFLCRCGSSSSKPFCDGSHKKAEFNAE